MAVTRISQLADEERARFDEWADRWIDAGLRTGPADRERFEAAVQDCYRFAGIDWPGVVVWVPSPIVLAFAAPAVERYGHDRLLREAGGKLLQQDDFGKLWHLDVPGDEALVMVEVVNSTAEPDGSTKTYLLRVPPRYRTARGAVAWTFGLERATYAPVVET